MKTEDLIATLSLDARDARPALTTVWWGALAFATIVAAAVFFSTLGLRPDFASAAETPRFLYKFVVTLALAASGFAAARAVSVPHLSRGRLALLAAAPLLLAAAVIVELLVVPEGAWAARAIGSNSRVCLTYIPVIGLAPLAIFLAVLRYGAPARPALAGAVAGALSGGVAASFYAAQCTDDSPLFVATWYPLAIAILAALGAAVAPRVARW